MIKYILFGILLITFIFDMYLKRYIKKNQKNLYEFDEDKKEETENEDEEYEMFANNSYSFIKVLVLILLLGSVIGTGTFVYILEMIKGVK
ncbi:MAG: hypothetical protein N4A47_05885 [Clostridia bacterium]|nr:hypothetical protein [Clostridia bacterium]